MAKNSVRTPSNSVIRVRQAHRPHSSVLFVTRRFSNRRTSTAVTPKMTQGVPTVSHESLSHANGNGVTVPSTTTTATVHTEMPPPLPQVSQNTPAPPPQGAFKALFTGLEFLRKFGPNAAALNPRLVNSTLQILGKIRAHRQLHEHVDHKGCPGCQGAQALRMYQHVAAARGIPVTFSDSAVTALIEDCTAERS